MSKNNTIQEFEPYVETTYGKTKIESISTKYVNLTIVFRDYYGNSENKKRISFYIKNGLPKLPIKIAGKLSSEEIHYILEDSPLYWFIDNENKCWINLCGAFKLVSQKEFLLNINDTSSEKIVRKTLGIKPRLPYWVKEAKKANWNPPSDWDWDKYEK